MSRIVVVMQPTLNSTPQFFLKEPAGDREANFPWSIDEDEMRRIEEEIAATKAVGGNGATFKTVGSSLMGILRRHPAIAREFDRLRSFQSDEYPIYLFMSGPNPRFEQWPWEVLYNDDIGFLSANKLFPIARARLAGGRQKSEWLYAPPLKIMAVMGASGEDEGMRISARKQWENLYAALILHRTYIALEVKLLLCETELKEQIDAQKLTWIETGLLNDRDALLSDIREFQPHILHFFCHGGVSALDIASWTDWDRKRLGSIHIECGQLQQRGNAMGNTWLVTLNCCDSAQAAQAEHGSPMPMACSLVSAGIPAVVGMRKKIAGDFSHKFCRSFYDELLIDFAKRLDTAKERGMAEVHWGCALFAIRQRVHDRNDVSQVGDGEWAIPVIYTRLESCDLRLAPESQTDRRLAEELAQLSEDSKLVANLPPVVHMINARRDQLIAELATTETVDLQETAATGRVETSDELPFPTRLAMNAFAGDQPVMASLLDDAKQWPLVHTPPRIRAFLKAEPKADPRDWRDPRNGWGLVLSYNERLSEAELATAIDAPEPIRALVSRRGVSGQSAPVLRYKPGVNRIGFLRSGGVDLPVSQSAFGTAFGAVPRYLLIYATPEQIPWEVQYSLNATRCVGRLDLTDAALENYVHALMDNWRDSPADLDAALVWATDHGPSDITNLMRKAIAVPVVAKLKGDRRVGPNTIYLDGSKAGEATTTKLIEALAAKRPSFILTSSHGTTGPLDNLDQMAAHLGLPIDSERSMLSPKDLLPVWQPGGAVWYAHACCSAGSNAQTIFDGLLPPDSLADLVLKGVARIGARGAPLPTALLGASRPLRAFIGHVEPTFDWTLQQNLTRQYTTGLLSNALYEELFQPSPVGLAMASYYAQLGGIYTDYDEYSRAANRAMMLHRLLVARDIQTTVILGDPATMLPL